MVPIYVFAELPGATRMAVHRIKDREDLCSSSSRSLSWLMYKPSYVKGSLILRYCENENIFVYLTLESTLFNRHQSNRYFNHEYAWRPTNVPLDPSERRHGIIYCWRDFDHLHRLYPINWPGRCRCRYQGNCGHPRGCHRVQSSDLIARKMDFFRRGHLNDYENLHWSKLGASSLTATQVILIHQTTPLSQIDTSASDSPCRKQWWSQGWRSHIRCRRRIRLGASMKKKPIRGWRHKGLVSQYFGVNLILDTGNNLQASTTEKLSIESGNDQISTFFGRAGIPQQFICNSIDFHVA